MAKKDIGKILSTGSARQRVLLIAEHRARVIYGEAGLLTPDEFNEIAESFKTSRDIRVWNEFRKYGSSVSSGITNLQGLKFEIMAHYQNLRGHILAWLTIESAELLANSILHEITDLEERKRVSRDGLVGVSMLFTDLETDPEGYVQILTGYEPGSDKTAPPHSLRPAFNVILKQTEEAVIRFMSWEKALLDYMDETGYNVKTHKNRIKLLASHVKSPIIAWAKYRGEITGKKDSPRLEKLLERYNVSPRILELEIDQGEYNLFKTVVLGYGE
jgi:hypothetical protein